MSSKRGITEGIKNESSLKTALWLEKKKTTTKKHYLEDFQVLNTLFDDELHSRRNDGDFSGQFRVLKVLSLSVFF